ncbi:MAG TPA: biotin-dependent carboxyltransferase family protein [Bacillota bacterium]
MTEGRIEVIAAGLLTTIQDLGRPGYARYGLGPGGAADGFALRAANLLVDNEPGAAGLEITLAGPELRFRRSISFAVSGADLGLELDGRTIPSWRGITARAGQTLRFRPVARGCRAYLAVSGGLDVPVSLGSRSSDPRARLGWREGRAVKAGDALPVAGGAVTQARLDRLALSLEQMLPPGQESPADYLDREVVAAADGPQADHFSPAALARFYRSVYQVAPSSDRMGLRLNGPAVSPERADIVSDGLIAGAVQVARDGRPVCLLAGHHTTGGYPKIAVIGRAHLRVAAQRPPLAHLSFVRVDPADLEEEAATYLSILRGWEERRLGELPGRLYRLRGGVTVRVRRQGDSPKRPGGR